MRPAQDPPPVIAVSGATASGKSRLALFLAERLGGELVSADSMQVYRGLDVGTAKPGPEERARVPHHGIDVVDPGEAWSAAEFRDMARRAVEAIAAHGRVPIVVGGTGLYHRALLDGLMPAPAADPALRAELRRLEAERGPGELHRMLAEVDPEAAARLHPRDLVRLERALEVRALTGTTISALHRAHRDASPGMPALRLRIDLPREVLNARIAERARAMVGAGWVDEVRGLLARGVDPRGRALQGLGYRRVVEHLEGACDADEMLRRVVADTRAYARRQVNWFRGDARSVSVPPPDEGLETALERARRFLQDPPPAGDGRAPAPGAPPAS